MAQIQGEDVNGAVALRQHDDRGAGGSDHEIPVPICDAASRGDVAGVEGSEVVGASGDIVEHRQLGVLAELPGYQVVEFGEDER